MTSETWFYVTDKNVPPGTRHVAIYEHFCYYMAFHPPAPQRIDGHFLTTNSSQTYSKLLNYVTMRMLDTDYQARVTTHELHGFLLVLENLARNLLSSGQW